MSIIVRDNSGQIWLLTKGAESYVLPLCKASNSALLAETQAHINDFAKIGFRTLAVARKKLTEEEYANYENGKYKLQTNTEKLQLHRLFWVNSFFIN